MTLEEALEKIKSLEADLRAKDSEISSILKNKNQILEEKKALQDRLGGKSPEELVSIAKRVEEGELIESTTVGDKVSEKEQSLIAPLQKQINQLQESFKKEAEARENAERAVRQEKKRSAVIQAFGDAVHSPGDLYDILDLRGVVKLNSEGSPVGVIEGVEYPMADFKTKLKEQDSYKYLFKAQVPNGSGQSGSGGSGDSAGSKDNPFKTGNITQQMRCSILSKAVRRQTNNFTEDRKWLTQF